MNWAHLPVAGGIYDQHPELLENFRYIFSKKSEYEKEKHRREQNERRSSSPMGSRSSSRRR